MSEVGATDNRRGQFDRRQRPTPALSRYVFSGRRREFRRGDEAANAYVDRYSQRLVAVLVAIVLLCVLDALFTLLYIQRGGSEANPLMAMAIEAGVVPFLLIKCGLTLVGMLFLCVHKNFRWVKVLIGGVLTLYTALLGYHIYLAIAV